MTYYLEYEKYEMEVNFTGGLSYTRQLDDPHSAEFRLESEQVSSAVESLYQDVAGEQSVDVRRFRY